MNRSSKVVLLVEDNADHAELLCRQLRKIEVIDTVHWLVDGEQTLNYLFRREQYAEQELGPLPDLVLLDLRLPKVDGFEVLRQMKECPVIKRIPVVVLTTSEADGDIDRAYDRYANSYLVKPLEFHKLTELVQDLGRYWFDRNQIPQLKS